MGPPLGFYFSLSIMRFLIVKAIGLEEYFCHISPLAPGTSENSHKKVASFLSTCTMCDGRANLICGSVFIPEWKVGLTSFLNGEGV